jgi:hypothetical protein
MAANIFNSNQEGNPMGRTLVTKIQSLLELEWEVIVRHSYREGNHSPDALANLEVLWIRIFVITTLV